MIRFAADPEILAETPRLALRWPQRGDALRLVPLLNDWNVARWLANVPSPFGISDARDWVRTARYCRRGGQVFVLVMTRRDDDVLIGGAELNLHRRETGYWIGSRFHRQGYGRETLQALMRLAFAEHRLPDLSAVTLPDNTPSRALLMSCGFAYQGDQPYDFGLRGGYRPGSFHTLAATSWRERMEESA